VSTDLFTLAELLTRKCRGCVFWIVVYERVKGSDYLNNNHMMLKLITILSENSGDNPNIIEFEMPTYYLNALVFKPNNRV
jgi:hypothetical protein